MLYRFVCLDAHDNAASTEEIDARSLIDAIAKAHMMLKSRPHHETVEVWLGNSLAYRAQGSRCGVGQFNLRQVGAYEGLEVSEWQRRTIKTNRPSRPPLFYG